MILAIDAGTTGITGLVISEDGAIRGRGYQELTQHFPQPGWVEHDAAEIWRLTVEVSRRAVENAGIRFDAVSAFGITNQRETTVLWDRATGEPVHRAIVWQDRRTTSICRRLKDAGHEPDVTRRTGLVLDPYFSASKLTWILESSPELRRRAEAGELAAGTVDSWLIWKLTGGQVHATDHTNASRTLLFNLETRAWDPSLLRLFGIPDALLPEVRPSSHIFGTTTAGIEAEIPIGGIAGDQQAALFGQGCWTAGLGKNTYGTGAFLLLHTGGTRVHSSNGLLTTAACGPRGEFAYALEGSIFVAGAAVQWLRDGLGLIRKASETDAMARSLDGNDGVYFVPAFTGLGAPHWQPDARGTVVGLSRGSTAAHLVRAALESMAYSTSDVAGAMESDSGVRFAELRVDGGAAANDWMMQFQADILGVPVRRPPMIETTAYGAAGLAGLAVGFWKSPEDFLAATRDGQTLFHPSLADEERRRIVAGWHRAVRTACSWAEEASA